ncbi:MAG TPA: TMEM175 family protein [Chthoniobacterales bacterium]|nr:TMEM175 family protein [Chthoniobacterales bacterium]
MERSTPNPPAETVSSFYGEGFTRRLEAFGDLVFGFSLSLLAIRLELPAKVEDIFEAARWGTFVITFGIVCVFWLAHYRVFRYQFVARGPDVVLNFVFLFGIAIMPFTVQTFLRFMPNQDAILLYFGDFALIFAALATLRCRALLQRRGDADAQIRLKEWRETVRQYGIVLVVIAALAGMRVDWIPREKFYTLVPAIFVVVMLVARVAVRQLPKFLE